MVSHYHFQVEEDDDDDEGNVVRYNRMVKQDRGSSHDSCEALDCGCEEEEALLVQELLMCGEKA